MSTAAVKHSEGGDVTIELANQQQQPQQQQPQQQQLQQQAPSMSSTDKDFEFEEDEEDEDSSFYRSSLRSVRRRKVAGNDSDSDSDGGGTGLAFGSMPSFGMAGVESHERGGKGGKKKAPLCQRTLPFNSRKRLMWDLVVTTLIVYTVIMVPIEIAFDPLTTEWALTTDLFVSTLFFLNIVFNFFTTVEKTDRIITDRGEIARYYLRHWFILDVLATVPFDVILRASLSNSGSSSFGMLRLLRLFRVFRLWSGSKFNLFFRRTSVRLARMIVVTFMLAHWTGLIWFTLSDYEGFPGRDPDTGDGYLMPEELSRGSLGFRYLVSLHFGLFSIFSLGSELRPVGTASYLFACLIIAIGVLTFSNFVGNIELLLQQADVGAARFQEHVNALNDWLGHKKISKSLKRRVFAHVQHHYRVSRAIDDHELLSVLPVETRNRVYRALYRDQLLRCEFFSRSNSAFLGDLCMYVRPQVALPGDYIIRQGSLGTEMYIIGSGNAEVINNSGEVVRLLEAGSFFGELALFTSTYRSASVRASTYMEMYVLEANDFMHVLQFFPGEEERFADMAASRLNDTDELIHHLQRLARLGIEISEEKLVQLAASKDLRAAVRSFEVSGDGVLDAEEQERLVRYLSVKKRRLAELARMKTARGRMLDEGAAAEDGALGSFGGAAAVSRGGEDGSGGGGGGGGSTAATVANGSSTGKNSNGGGGILKNPTQGGAGANGVRTAHVTRRSPHGVRLHAPRREQLSVLSRSASHMAEGDPALRQILQQLSVLSAKVSRIEDNLEGDGPSARPLRRASRRSGASGAGAPATARIDTGLRGPRGSRSQRRARSTGATSRKKRADTSART